MSVAASQAPSTGIEALLAATSSAPASKTPASASTGPGQTAPAPDLFGQMLANEVAEQAAAARGAGLDSTAAAAPAAGASKKVAGGKGRLAAEAAATAPDPFQHLTAADAAPVPAPYEWLPENPQLAFAPAAASRWSSATSETRGDGAAGQTSTPSTGTLAEAATATSLPAATPGATAGLGRSFADNNMLTDGGRPSNPATETAPAVATEAAGSTQETASAAVAAQAEIAARMPDRTGNTVTDDAPRTPVNAVSISQTPTSIWPATTAPPVETTPETGRSAASLTRNRVELRPAEVQATKSPATEPPATGQHATELRAVETRATDSPATESAVAQAARDAAGEVMTTAASLFARLVARSGGQTSDPEDVPRGQHDTSVAAGSDGLEETGTLAFQALLVPVPAADRQFAGQTTPDTGDASARSASAGGNSTPGTSAGPGGSRSSSPAPRDPNPGLALTAQAGQTSGAAQTLAPAAVSPDAGAAASPSASRSHGAATASASPEAARAAELASAPKPAAGGVAREIHLELRDADARVNVRLVERAGGVQVDVRTPDSRLAASLRDDLPTLAARLEQTGLRTESWHDAPAATAERMRTAEAASTTSAESSQNQSQREGGKNNPHDDQPREKRQQQPSAESKEFTWLYTSLT